MKFLLLGYLLDRNGQYLKEAELGEYATQQAAKDAIPHFQKEFTYFRIV
ncbi:hypothetical protein JK635_07385 [Neobacillus sp. YIM B02564]|uniref:SPOR domain-containing protein n=1 Tax=Neobacillus paridis TaxID=2803862 RepID=A0ABS1TP49_9BACI|nr:hypothetical protein [Neobacillus paridis]MBL4952031.1 hypothetical protein [Neobacillus paridis]